MLPYTRSGGAIRCLGMWPYEIIEVISVRDVVITGWFQKLLRYRHCSLTLVLEHFFRFSRPPRLTLAGLDACWSD